MEHFSGKVVTVAAVDPVTGAQRSRTTIDMNEYMPAAGFLQGLYVGLDGAAVLIRWTAHQTGPIRSLYVDMTTGQRRRLDIRPQREQDWWVQSIRPEGVVTTDREGDTFVLRLVDPATGAQRTLTTVRNAFGDMYAVQVRGT